LIKLLKISNDDDKNLFVYTTKLLPPEIRRTVGTTVATISNITAATPIVTLAGFDIDELVVVLLYETIPTISYSKRKKNPTPPLELKVLIPY